MTNRKTTKRALISSLLALLICCTMLVGTTFAWFTDSEYIKNNVIKAGTLNIELGSEATLFSFTNKWEPGLSEDAATTLTNVGNLALKYTFNIDNVVATDGAYDNQKVPADGNPDGSNLAKVLDVYVGTTKADMTPENYLGTLQDLIDQGNFGIHDDGILLPGEVANVQLIIKMQKTAGNEYMNDEVKFDISVLATQYTYEEDGFGDIDYDVNATYAYPAASYTTAGVYTLNDNYTSADEATDAVFANGDGVIVNINGGTYTGNDLGASYAVYAKNNAVVNITDGTFVATAAGNAVIYAGDGATVNISGGFYDAAGPYQGTYFTLNLKDNTNAKINVTGGTFVNFDPSNANTEPGGPVSFVADGYTVTSEEQANGDIWYTVVKA